MHQHAETHEVRNYNGRPLECFSIDTVSSIFLRIPDVVKGPSALQQLEKGISVTSLGPAGNTFLNWDDFILTLVEIVKTEGIDQFDTTWFNAIKNNRSSGHRDHKLTAKAVAGVASIIANSHPDKIVKIAWFEGTARKMFTHDENIHKRVAALLA